jgi:NAD(P)H-hydrate epimerase
MLKVTKEVLKLVFTEREKNKYYKKYDFGLLLVIGGSEIYSGSPALNAMAAFRSGVGMVKIIAPKRAADIISSFSPNLVSYPLDGKYLKRKHLKTLFEITEYSKNVADGNVAVVIGGGIGREKETQKAIISYLEKIDIPAVIDADAIYAVAKNKNVIKENFLITPHPYEFFVLTNRKVYQLPVEEQIKIVQEEAEKLKAVILLKGKPDIISNGKEIALCEFGSPYMAVGGTGDTLAGICGALLSRKIDPFLAAQAGAYINGRAGEIAGERLKEGLTATDLIDAIPEVLKE